MLYDIKSLDLKTKELTFVKPGIYDNVKMSEIRVGQGPTGNDFIEFTFLIGDKTVKHTEWPPRKTDADTDETYNERCKKQAIRFGLIVKCFYKEEELSFEGNTFKELITWVKQMLDAKKDTELLRVKFVYNFNGFVALPNYSKYTFMEPMSIVNKGESVIVPLRMDKFTKDIVPDVEDDQEQNNGLGTTETNINLPF